MQDDIIIWLTDIQQAIDEIFDFLPEKKDFLIYQKDIKTKKAVERNLEIIGEAFSRILKVEPNIQITNVKNIVNTRNRIIHGYDKISDEIIWAIVIRDLPFLKAEIDSLLSAK